MILHLTQDEKFINGANYLFECYYPNQNHFIVHLGRTDGNIGRYVKAQDNVQFKALSRKSDLQEIIRFAKTSKIRHVLVHYLSPLRAALANQLKQELSAKTYWIFYGADMYQMLQDKGQYQLYDHPKQFSKSKGSLKSWLLFWYLFQQSADLAQQTFIKDLDFFCFWNEYDYQLLIKHFDTSAEHKPFLYYNVIDRKIAGLNVEKSAHKVMVNHAASSNGNHETVLNKLAKLDANHGLISVICPLSYGSSLVQNQVQSIGNQLFENRFQALLDFLPKDEYHKMLNDIPVAIFGNRRQEAGGNVFYLLSRGTKVFLRKQNSMLKWLKDRDFIVFNFEEQLQSFRDLLPLSEKEMQHNQRIFSEVFSIQKEEENMKGLIEL